MVWFPVLVYRWVRESIRRIPATFTRLGIFNVPNDNGQERLVLLREDEEQQSPPRRQKGHENDIRGPDRSCESICTSYSEYEADVLDFPPMSPGGPDQHESPSDTPENTVGPYPQPTNWPQQVTDAGDGDDPGYGGNDVGQTGYRTPDTDSGYESMG